MYVSDVTMSDEIMPFGPYDSMSDCISKNPQAEDPGAYCAQIHYDITGKWPSEKKEALIHHDFLKIYKQFLNYEDGENRYALWVKALNLDETKPYGLSRREQFKWIKKHVDFEFWKEDRGAKYWRVEAGFPLESMNMNVYSNDELLRSARTIKGQPVNLNHSNILGAVEILAGEYEDGVVECVLRVPHSARCVKGNKVNDLIEQGNIVNVSLEASCAYTSSDVGGCGGMYFTGLALLTKETLPGIPLTRIIPLESIMVEALQSSTKIDRRKKKVTKLKMEAIEQDEETDEHGCVKGKQTWDSESEKCVEIQEKALTADEIKAKIKDLLAKRQQLDAEHDQESDTFWTEYDLLSIEINALEDALAAIIPLDILDVGEKKILEDTKEFIRKLKAKREQVTTVDITPVVPKPSTEPDEHGQCPEGKRLNALGKCVETEECGEGRHWDANANEGQGDCVADTPPKPEHPETSHGLPAAPQEDVLTDAPLEQPKTGEQPPTTGTKKIPPTPAAGEQPAVTGDTPEPQEPMQPTEPGEIKPKPPHECPDGHHYDYDVDQCVPDAPIVERVKRIKAELKAKNATEKAAKWELHYVKLDEKFQQLRGTCQELRSNVKSMLAQGEQHRKDLVEAQVARDKAIRLRDEAAGLRDDFHAKLEKFRRENTKLAKQYDAILTVATSRNERNVELNAEILEHLATIEQLNEKLKKALILNKKQHRTLKVQT